MFINCIIHIGIIIYKEMIGIILKEETRTQLINKSKSSYKGKQRFDRRTRSKVMNTTSAMNKIDMNKLFTEDILTVGIPVQGETDNYTVTVSFGGFLQLLKDEIERSNTLSYREIARAAINGFNKDDVYISCSCPDQEYRFQYWATRNNYNSTYSETRPSRITNPDDSLGSTCKHSLLILSNTSWMQRVARVIYNYIKYMETHYQRMYADKIYPAIYGKEYEDPVQITLFDTDELDTTSDTIDTANKWRRDSTRFKPGNQSGVQFARNSNNDATLPLVDENPDDVL